MADVLSTIGEGLEQSFLMAYEVWWALVLGFAISAIVQAWVPRERIEATLSGRRRQAGRLGDRLGAASSSCSYAAIAIAKSLFQKGASAATALAFQFASTNLVWELGLVLWVLLGWQFTLAEYVGGIVMIVLMAVLLRRLRLAAAGGAGAPPRPGGRRRPPAPRRRRREALALAPALTSAAAWSDVAHNFRGDWQMLWKEITSASCSPASSACSATTSSTPSSSRTRRRWSAIENVIVGPLIAVLSFVCSVGNMPLAAVLWSGGISFAGVMAFIFADLIVLPIVARLPQVLRQGLRPADHRADVRDDGDRGAARRRPLQRRWT